MDINEIRKIAKEVEMEMESPEYIAEHKRIEEMCNNIKAMPLTTKEEILKAKEASRPIPQSAEKVLLFRHLIMIEDKLSK